MTPISQLTLAHSLSRSAMPCTCVSTSPSRCAFALRGNKNYPTIPCDILSHAARLIKQQQHRAISSANRANFSHEISFSRFLHLANFYCRLRTWSLSASLPKLIEHAQKKGKMRIELMSMLEKTTNLNLSRSIKKRKRVSRSFLQISARCTSIERSATIYVKLSASRKSWLFDALWKWIHNKRRSMPNYHFQHIESAGGVCKCGNKSKTVCN